MKVVLSARAERDVERLWAFLASKNPRAADRFLDEIERAYRSLSDFPDRGRPARPDFRELVVPFGRGAYILRYTMSRHHAMVVVVRIWHGREKRE